ncbi:polysaccharide biosynthesis/export family protein [Arcticibacter svalbardensis]|nr:polysaccharide biosynthesis/export family protein [Arcticibacter svalbardensis]
MTHKFWKIFALNFMFISGLTLISSCVSTKNIPYFQNLNQTDRKRLDSVTNFTEPIIQPDDILSVSIITVDPQTAAVINQSNPLETMGTPRNPSSREIEGFSVDKNGEIELAIIGNVKVGGLTTFQARDLIRTKAARYFQKPNVSVRFANFKISILGEVNRPGSYTLPNEKVTILDALSLSGDLTLYGKRENIMIIRDVNGRKEYGTVSINSSNIFNSPYYFLKQNDVVYVEPNKSKVFSLNNTARSTAVIALSALSTIVLIITRIY